MNIPGPIVSEGPMTRRRSRDENVNQPVNAATTKVFTAEQSAVVGPKFPAKGKEVPTARQRPRMTTRAVAPRQPARTRRAPVDVQVRKQPDRNARKKAVQDSIPRVKGIVFLPFSLSIYPVHLTCID